MTKPAADAALPGVLAERYAAQLLSGPPADTAEQVSRHLLAIQAQDLRGARLAIRARSRGLTAADVDQALTTERSLVVGWLNRGTLHLVHAADYWMLHRLTTPQLQATCTRRLAQEGVPAPDADRGAALIERSFTEHGALTRAQLGERLNAAGIRTEGQALVYLIFLASLRGIAVRGPVIGSEQAFVLARDWLGAPPAVDREAALGWLARRYLTGHAPATERDLAKWAGLALRDARQGLAHISAELDYGGDGLVRLANPASGDGRSPRPGAGRPGVPSPRLLGAFDPVLHGWLSREPVLGPHERKIILGGMFRPFALVGGRAVGTWTLSRGRVAVNLLEDLTAGDHAALRADAADVERFLGTAGPCR